jgi:hypothetical protein
MAIVHKKQARGAVLGLLEESYPIGVAYTTLMRVLVSAGKCHTHELPAVIRYLEDKGYIRVQTPEEPELKPLDNSVIDLAAHGVDLLEGSVDEDPGILF